MKVFIEYKVRSEYKQQYVKFMGEIQAKFSHVELFEGTDQPGLFVEIWHDCSFHEYEKIKNDRITQPTPEWEPLNTYIEGGKDKQHMWHFKLV